MRDKTAVIAKLFQRERFATKRELNTISQIVADSTKVFPPDFISLTPEYVSTAAQALFKRSIVTSV